MKVTFLKDAKAVLESGETTLFTKGQTVELNTASAERWIHRGIAEIAAEASVAKPKAAKKKSKKSAK